MIHKNVDKSCTATKFHIKFIPKMKKYKPFFSKNLFKI